MKIQTKNQLIDKDIIEGRNTGCKSNILVFNFGGSTIFITPFVNNNVFNTDYLKSVVDKIVFAGESTINTQVQRLIISYFDKKIVYKGINMNTTTYHNSSIQGRILSSDKEYIFEK